MLKLISVDNKKGPGILFARPKPYFYLGKLNQNVLPFPTDEVTP